MDVIYLCPIIPEHFVTIIFFGIVWSSDHDA